MTDWRNQPEHDGHAQAVIRRALARMSIGASCPLWGLRVEARGSTLMISFVAPDRDSSPTFALGGGLGDEGATIRRPDIERLFANKQMRQLEMTVDIGAGLLDEETVIETVRRHLIKIAQHEIDECLLVDGRRAWDPHAGGTS